MKDMEVGRRLRVSLTELRMCLVDTRRWTRRDQRAGEWSINLSGEKRRITDIFLAQRYNLAFPSMFHGSHANVVRILNWSYTPACSESASCSVPSSCKKAESTACLTIHRQERSILRSSSNWHIWRNTHRWAMGRGRGRRGAARPRRLRTQTHGGESDCSTSPGNSRETFRRYLRKLRMLYINSCTTPILRAAVNNKYMACNRHVLILQYFIVEFQ